MTARGHKKTHRIRRVLLAVAGGLLLLLIAFVIAGLWRLKKGPVSLASFIPKLEQALSREISPMSVEIEDVTLSFAGWRSPLDLSAQEVSIIQTSGDELVRLEELGIELSFEPLLHGELAPSKIDARGLAISVVRDEDGTFELDLGGTGSSGTQTGLGLAGWLDQWLDSAATPSVLSELDRISVSQGTLELADKALGRTFKAADIDLELSREPTGLEATLDGKLGLGDGSVEVSAAASFPRQERRLSGRVELDGLQPSMLAWTGKVPECLQSLDPTIYARAELRFGKGFDLAAADFDLTADKLQATGSVDLSGQTAAISIQLTSSGVEPSAYAAVCKELEELDRITFPVDAKAGLELAGKELVSLSFELTGGKGSLEVSELYSQPLSIHGTTVKGHTENGFDKLFLDEARIEIDDVVLKVHGSAERQGESYVGSLEGLIDELSVPQLHSLWPKGAAEGVRQWVLSSIPSGMVHDLQATFAGGLALEAPKKPSIEALEVVFAYDDLEVIFLAPQPPVTAVDGTAVFTKERFDFNVDRGKVRELEVSESRVQITGLTSGTPLLAIHATLAGSVEPVVDVVTGEPLTIVSPELLAGLTAELSNATLDLEVPLVSNENAPQIDYSATGEISNLFWPRAPGDLEVSGGEASMRLDRRALEIQGDARFNGVPAEIEYRENLQQGGPKRQIEAHARVDVGGARALGLPDQPYVSGSVELEVSVLAHWDHALEVGAKADLQETILAIPQIGWQKPVGEPGTTTLEARKGARTGWLIEPLQVTGGDLEATGRIRLADDSLSLREVDLDLLKLDGSRLRASLAVDEDQGIHLRVAGSRLDLQRILPHVRQPKTKSDQVDKKTPTAESETGRSLRFDIEIDEVVFSPDVQLTTATATGFFDGGHWQSLLAEARIGAEAKGSFDYRPQDGEYRLLVQARDIGDVISHLTASEEVAGGTLRIDGSRPSADEPMAGRFIVQDFRVLQSPALFRLLTAVTLTEPLSNLQGTGLEFSVVEGDFSFDKGRLQLSDTWANGPGIHITAEGWIDPRRRSGDITGSLAWEGRVLRFLSKIPLVGRVVAGKDRKGLFVTEFEIAGSFEDPTVDAKVLGTLAPGFTRDFHNRLKRYRKELKAEKKAEKKSP
ncbi:MAG: AsmA-like C-terminal domain-containing protein [Thermoanaerobaculia bacterium]